MGRHGVYRERLPWSLGELLVSELHLEIGCPQSPFVESIHSESAKFWGSLKHTQIWYQVCLLVTLYIYILNLQFCWLIPRFWWVETPIWFSSTSLHRNWNRFNSDKVVSQPQHYWVQQGTGKHNCGVVFGVPCSKQGWSFQTCEGRILEIVVTCHFPLKNAFCICPWPT